MSSVQQHWLHTGGGQMLLPHWRKNSVKTEVTLGRPEHSGKISANELKKDEIGYVEYGSDRYYYLGIGDGKRIRFINGAGRTDQVMLQSQTVGAAQVKRLVPGESITITLTA
jgi:hypothetical protein